LADVRLRQNQQAAVGRLFCRLEPADEDWNIELPQRLEQCLVADGRARIGGWPNLVVGISGIAEQLQVQHADKSQYADRDDDDQGAWREYVARLADFHMFRLAHAPTGLGSAPIIR